MKHMLFAIAVGMAALGFGAPANAAPAAPAIAVSDVGSKLPVIKVQRFRGEFRCVAIGRRIDGVRIPGTRRVAFGGNRRRVCRRALRRCRRALGRRQDVGLNPFGRCFVRRGRRF